MTVSRFARASPGQGTNRPEPRAGLRAGRGSHLREAVHGRARGDGSEPEGMPPWGRQPSGVPAIPAGAQAGSQARQGRVRIPAKPVPVIPAAASSRARDAAAPPAIDRRARARQLQVVGDRQLGRGRKAGGRSRAHTTSPPAQASSTAAAAESDRPAPADTFAGLDGPPSSAGRSSSRAATVPRRPVSTAKLFVSTCAMLTFSSKARRLRRRTSIAAVGRPRRVAVQLTLNVASTSCFGGVLLQLFSVGPLKRHRMRQLRDRRDATEARPAVEGEGRA